MKEIAMTSQGTYLILDHVEFCAIDNKTLEQFRCGLLSFGEPSAFLNILLPFSAPSSSVNE